MTNATLTANDTTVYAPEIENKVKTERLESGRYLLTVTYHDRYWYKPGQTEQYLIQKSIDPDTGKDLGDWTAHDGGYLGNDDQEVHCAPTKWQLIAFFRGCTNTGVMLG